MITAKDKFGKLLLTALLFAALQPARGQSFGGDDSSAPRRFRSDAPTANQTEVSDVPGLIGLAAVAEQYNDQNKADRYYNKAHAILDAVDHIEGPALLWSLKRFDRLIEDDRSPAAHALHIRMIQLASAGPGAIRSQLTIGPETDTVKHEEPAATMIRQGQMAFQMRNFPTAFEQLKNAFDFESKLRSTVKSEESDQFHMCLRADTAYKLAVVDYYMGQNQTALNYISHVVDVYDNFYGQDSQPSVRAHAAFNEIKAASQRATDQQTAQDNPPQL